MAMAAAEKMNVVVMDTHPLQDSRIGRHIQYLLHEKMEVYHLNYNFYDAKQIGSNIISRYGEMVLKIDLFNRFNRHRGLLKRVLNTKYLSGGEIVQDTSRSLKEIGMDFSRPALIHVHDPILLPLASNLVKRFRDWKAVYDRHELYDKCQKDCGINMPRMLEEVSKRQISGVITVSDSHMPKVRSLFPNIPVVSVPNYPSCSDYDTKRIEAKIEAIDASNLVLSYIGSLDSSFDRDIDLMLKIASAALERTGTKFIIGGRAPNANFEMLMEEYAHKFPNSFQFPGYVPREKAIEYTEKSHLGFLFIKPETRYWVKTSPNKVFEYLICGVVPVIRADVDSAEAMAECALLFSRNAGEDEIIGSVLELISDKERLKGMIKRARFLSSRHTFESVANRYLEMYRAIMPKSAT